MKQTSARWHVLGEPASPAEAAALDALRGLLPDDGVAQAWTNLTFTDLDGRINEIDALIVTRAGVHVVELKGWHGRISGDQQTWMHTNPGGQVRTVRNPLYLTDSKAKRLRSLLQSKAPTEKGRRLVPYIGAMVVLHGRDSTIDLDPLARTGVLVMDGYGVTGTPEPRLVSDFLAAPPHHAPIDSHAAKVIHGLVERAGFVATPKTRFVGQYSLEKADPLRDGPAWQDLLARHPAFPETRRRIRVFDIPQGSSSDRRREIELAAKREFLLTRGIHHDGIVSPLEYLETDSGPALVFDHDDVARPLDAFLAAEGAGWGVDERLALIRRIAELLRYAHDRRLTHRALTPRQIDVVPGSPGHAPRVAIRDWHTGAHGIGRGGPTTTAPTTIARGADDVRSLVSQHSWVYLAPEALYGGSELPAIPLDIYGLGASAYLVLTGKPPAASLAELQRTLESHGCLDPSASTPDLSTSLVDLVRNATRRVESERTATVEAFLADLERAEDEFTAPDEADDRPAPSDPLEAAKGDLVAQRFEVRARRGTGSTGTAFLVDDYVTGREALILKIAKDDAAAGRLLDEAAVLASLDHPRVVRLVEGPLELDGRRALLLSDAGPETLAARLAAEGRSTLEQLERYGGDLLDAVAHLDARGVFHRDIKPSNLGIAPDPGSRKPHLVLFDLSLAREPLEHTTSGTHGYVDPFLGRGRRRRYDRAAELFAVAVTLFEMATSERPWWRAGATAPSSLADRVVLTAELFDPAAAPALREFFRQALAPEASDRFPDAAAMAQAWRDVFADLDTGAGGAGLDQAGRDAAAEAASLDTPLEQAGLTVRALSAVSRLAATTVGELIGTPPMTINALPGLGEQYRKEIQARLRQWRLRLLDPTTDAPAALGGDRSVEAILRSLIERPGQTAGDKGALQALVGLDGGGQAGPGGDASTFWLTEADAAATLGVARTRVADALGRAASRWAKSPALREVADEVQSTLVAESGVATLSEVSSAILLRHGSMAEGPERLRRAAGLVRAVSEADARAESPRFAVRRGSGGVVLLALATGTTGERAAAEGGEVALEFAEALGAAADALVREAGILPAAPARSRLRESVPARGLDVPDGRVLRLAAAASSAAELSAVGELHRADLPPEEAVDHALRGVGVRELAEAGVRRRVSARFPSLPPLPTRPALDALVARAVPGMSWDGERYARAETSSAGSRASTTYTRAQTSSYDEVDARLRASLRARSALTLCAHPRAYATAADALARSYGVTVVDVGAELVRAVRSTAERGNVAWDLVLRADAVPGAGGDWTNLLRLIRAAWSPRWAQVVADAGPLLLVNAGPLARYGMTDLLSGLLDQSQPRPAARWLLVPRRSAAATPTLDGHAVPMGPDGWIDLPAAAAVPRSAVGMRP